MKWKRRSLLFMVMGVLSTGLSLPSVARSQTTTEYQDTKTTFVHLGNGVPVVLYEPTNIGPKSAIAVFVMHAEADYLHFSACTELSKRGYRVLCANNSASKWGSNNDLSVDKAVLSN